MQPRSVCVLPGQAADVTPKSVLTSPPASSSPPHAAPSIARTATMAPTLLHLPIFLMTHPHEEARPDDPATAYDFATSSRTLPALLNTRMATPSSTSVPSPTGRRGRETRR